MEKSCNGACIYGKCPFPYCIKYKQRRSEAVKRFDSAAVLKNFEDKNIISDKSGYGFAVDIGTTTIALYLYDLRQSKILAVKSAINPQVANGTDVLSRISYCERFEEGLHDLQKMVVTVLNELLDEACEEARMDVASVTYSVITGNTTMLHLLAGISPVQMGTYPFIPVSHFGEIYTGEELGFKNPKLEIFLPPCISAFVGADITTAILSSGMEDSDKNSLIMDLGTNGELVLKFNNKLYVTSAPAGPAFEGAMIECGMASVNGAVSEVYPFDGRLEYKVIGECAPRGICGSGLLDAVSFFLMAGVIDETGLIVIPDGLKPELRQYVVSDGENLRIQLTDKVYITQKDIRELQNAKAAVSAGVECLIQKSGADIDDIQKIYLAGGFGNSLKVESAAEIGLIDKRFMDKTVCIGNGAAGGAAMILLNDKYKEEALRIAKSAEHIEIGGDELFAEKFIEKLGF